MTVTKVLQVTRHTVSAAVMLRNIGLEKDVQCHDAAAASPA